MHIETIDYIVGSKKHLSDGKYHVLKSTFGSLLIDLKKREELGQLE